MPDKARKLEFDELRAEFVVKHGLVADKLCELLRDQDSDIAKKWRAHLANKSTQYCIDCHKYHKPTATCVPCEFSPGFLHRPMPKEIYFNYRGWKFTPPFICMGCGIEVCHNQWAFSRSCGPCDVSDSITRRVLYGQCFAGPHEKLPTWDTDNYDISEDHFLDPEDREKFPVMRQQPPIRPKKFVPRKPPARKPLKGRA